MKTFVASLMLAVCVSVLSTDQCTEDVVRMYREYPHYRTSTTSVQRSNGCCPGHLVCTAERTGVELCDYNTKFDVFD